jgi:hypothetical protein
VSSLQHLLFEARTSDIAGVVMSSAVLLIVGGTHNRWWSDSTSMASTFSSGQVGRCCGRGGCINLYRRSSV